MCMWDPNSRDDQESYFLIFVEGMGKYRLLYDVMQKPVLKL